jgi:hypothetical protein
MAGLSRNRVIAFAAPLLGVGLGALVMVPLLDRTLSPVTSGVMIGAAGAICLIGIAPGSGTSAAPRRAARPKNKSG